MSPGRRVLLIEDSDDARTSLQILLGCWGHGVEVAADGEQGIRKAVTWRPEVIISDIGLPGGIDGFEVARQVRAVLGGSVLLLALTAYSSGRTPSKSAGERV